MDATPFKERAAEDLLFAEAEWYFNDMDREFSDEDLRRLAEIRQTYAKYNFFGGTSLIGRVVMALPMRGASLSQ